MQGNKMNRTHTPAYASRAEAREAGEWFKKVADGVFKYGSEKIGTEGGFLVPDLIASAIHDVREKVGVFRRHAKVVNFSGTDSLNVPKRTSGATVTWTNENTAATESQAAYSNIGLNPKKLFVIVRASTELVEDSAFLGDWLTNEIAFDLESAIEKAAWQGDGTSTYKGIAGLATAGLGTSAAVTLGSGIDTWAELTATEMATIVYNLPAKHHDNAAWYFHPQAWGLGLCRLAATAGAPQYVNGELHYMGYPVRLSHWIYSGAAASTDFTDLIIGGFGDLRAAAMLGENRAVNVRRSDSRYMDLDQVTFAGTSRCDIVWHDLGNSFLAIKGGT
jgi:HK97 family phage major capsid protein